LSNILFITADCDGNLVNLGIFWLVKARTNSMDAWTF